MKRRVIIISGIVLILVIVGVGAYIWQGQQAKTTAAASVQTTTVKRGSLAASVSAAGNISAPNIVAVAFQASGVISKENVAVGDIVKKDQVLMELDSTDLNLALKTAQANLANAQTSYDQTKADLNYALRNAQSSLDSSKANLDAAVAKNSQNPNSLTVAKAALDKASAEHRTESVPLIRKFRLLKAAAHDFEKIGNAVHHGRANGSSIFKDGVAPAGNCQF
jgi:multidrug efflux pump subunit AcrA (membrane-fusion protein)